MINKWLDILEEKLNSDYDECYCGVATTLFTLDYPMDVWCLDCDEDNQKLCKAKAQEIINKIKKEWEWYQVELAHKIKLALENKQAISEETSDTQKDKVNHPSHYNAPKHECIDEMIAVFGVEAVKHFCMCNAWKYRYRAGAKDGEEKEKVLAKADWYIEILMELGQKGETK